MDFITVYIKSGQSLALLDDEPLSFSSSFSVAQLKALVSARLGGTPAASEMVLAQAREHALVELDEMDFSRLRKMQQELFVFTAKLWRAQGVIHGARRRLMSEGERFLRLVVSSRNHYGSS